MRMLILSIGPNNLLEFRNLGSLYSVKNSLSLERSLEHVEVEATPF